MQLFKRISSLVRRLYRGAGADADAAAAAAQEVALAEAFARKRDAFIAFVAETSLSHDLKRRLTYIAMDSSRWDELRERVNSIVSYLIDLWDCGGESSDDILRVAGRVRELS